MKKTGKTIKDMIGLTVLSSLAVPTFAAIGSAGMGAIGGLTQSFVGLGIMGHSTKMAKGLFKKK